MTDKKDRKGGRLFRIKDRFLDVLRKESERKGIPVNSLLNKILEDYSVYYRYFERYDAVTMTKKSLSRIVKSCPEENLTETARKGGTQNVEDVFRTIGLNLDRKGVTFFITGICGKYAKWFKCEHYLKEDKEVFHLRHHLGKKWSLYVAEVISTIYQYALNIKVSIEPIEAGVTVEVPLLKPVDLMKDHIEKIGKLVEESKKQE